VEVVELLAASRATAVSVWLPFRPSSWPTRWNRRGRLSHEIGAVDLELHARDPTLSDAVAVM